MAGTGQLEPRPYDSRGRAPSRCRGLRERASSALPPLWLVRAHVAPVRQALFDQRLERSSSSPTTVACEHERAPFPATAMADHVSSEVEDELEGIVAILKEMRYAENDVDGKNGIDFATQLHISGFVMKFAITYNDQLAQKIRIMWGRVRGASCRARMAVVVDCTLGRDRRMGYVG
jgi:hypothetical protein